MVRRICIISLGVKGLIDATFLTPEIDTHELPRVSFWFSSRHFGKVAVIQKFQYFQNVKESFVWGGNVDDFVKIILWEPEVFFSWRRAMKCKTRSGEERNRDRRGEKISGFPRQLIDLTAPIDLN